MSGTVDTDAGTLLAARRAYSDAPARPAVAALPTAQAEVVKRFTPLVLRIAKRVRRRTGFLVELDDLMCEGMIGLLQAAERFDPARAIEFEHLASVRVQGAMLDSLRRLDPMSQRRRREARKVRAMEEKLATVLGRAATADEMARALGLPLDDYHKLALECATTPPVSLDDMTADIRGPGIGQDEMAIDKERATALKAQIEQLPERQRLVLSLIYYNELSQKEVSTVLGVTEARVSQLHKEALDRLRKRILGANRPGESAW